MPSCESQHVFEFENFYIKGDRIIASLRVTDEQFACTNAVIAYEVSKKVPHIMQHTCLNDEGPTFAAVADHTSMPHVLEHVVIALQAQREPSYKFGTTYVGKTYWTDRGSLRACVEVNFVDDFVALESFTDAASLLNSIVIK